MEIYFLLQAAKAESGIKTDADLALRVGVTKAAVSRWRKGTTVPDDRYARVLAQLALLPVETVLKYLRKTREQNKQRACKHNRVDKQFRRSVESWEKDAVTRRECRMIRRFEYHDAAVVDAALLAMADAVEAVRSQIEAADRRPAILTANLWSLGYVCGTIEAAVQRCDVRQAAAIAAFVEMGFQRLLRTKEHAAQAMHMAHTFRSRDEFTSGHTQGAHDRKQFHREGKASAALSAHLRTINVSEAPAGS